MRGSRVLVAVLAVLCLSAMSSAAVTNTYDVTGTNGCGISGYTTYTTNPGAYVGGGYFYYAQYDISDIISDPTVAIVSAKLVYNREYVNDSAAIQDSPATITVAEPMYNYTLDTCTNVYDTNTNAFHLQLIGGTRWAAQLMAVRTCTATDVVNDPAAGFGPYAGSQSIDITPIVQDWKNGAQSYGCSLAMDSQPFQQHLDRYALFMPYIEVVTTSVPEPVTMGLLAVGGIATLLRRRRNA